MRKRCNVTNRMFVNTQLDRYPKDKFDNQEDDAEKMLAKKGIFISKAVTVIA